VGTGSRRPLRATVNGAAQDARPGQLLDHRAAGPAQRLRSQAEAGARSGACCRASSAKTTDATTTPTDQEPRHDDHDWRTASRRRSLPASESASSRPIDRLGVSYQIAPRTTISRALSAAASTTPLDTGGGMKLVKDLTDRMREAVFPRRCADPGCRAHERITARMWSPGPTCTASSPCRIGDHGNRPPLFRAGNAAERGRPLRSTSPRVWRRRCSRPRPTGPAIVTNSYGVAAEFLRLRSGRHVDDAALERLNGTSFRRRLAG